MRQMTHPLIGKTILKIKISEDNTAILFLVKEKEEPIIASTEGECCSETWIEHIELPAMGFPSKVISVTNLQLSSEHEPLKYYGCNIETDKGDITIDYRNSSEGSYGGWLCWEQHMWKELS